MKCLFETMFETSLTVCEAISHSYTSREECFSFSSSFSFICKIVFVCRMISRILDLLCQIHFHFFFSFNHIYPQIPIQQRDNSLKKKKVKRKIKKEQRTILYLQRIIWNVTVVSAALPRDRALG